MSGELSGRDTGATPTSPEQPQKRGMSDALERMRSLRRPIPDGAPGRTPGQVDEDRPPQLRRSTSSAESETGQEADTFSDEDLLLETTGEIGAVDADDDDPVVWEDNGAPVKRSEARKGYMRQSDYSAKTAETAKARQQAQAEIAAASQLRERYGQELQLVVQQLEANAPAKPDEKLRATDPLGYQDQMLAYLTHQDLVRENRAKLEQLVVEHRAENERQWAIQREEAQQRMIDIVPSLRAVKGDKAKLAKVFNRLKTTAYHAGYTDHELSQILDPRVGLILELASIGLAFRNRRGANKKASPMTIKGQGAGGRVAPVSVQAQKSSVAMQKLEKSGSIGDAMAVVRARREAKRSTATLKR